MLLLQSHYRGPVSVGQDNIDASVNALAGLDSFASRTAGVAAADADADVLARFRERMDDDLDTPGATALLFDTVRRANAALDADDPGAAGCWSPRSTRSARRSGWCSTRVATCRPTMPPRLPHSTLRELAKDFATADSIRAELQAAGWTVETTKAGTTLRR